MRTVNCYNTVKHNNVNQKKFNLSINKIKCLNKTTEKPCGLVKFYCINLDNDLSLISLSKKISLTLIFFLIDKNALFTSI